MGIRNAYINHPLERHPGNQTSRLSLRSLLADISLVPFWALRPSWARNSSRSHDTSIPLWTLQIIEIEQIKKFFRTLTFFNNPQRSCKRNAAILARFYIAPRTESLSLYLGRSIR
jgi:hypothetical protein